MQFLATKHLCVLQWLSISLLLASCGGGDSDTRPARTAAPTSTIANSLPSSTWIAEAGSTSQQLPTPGTTHAFVHVWNLYGDSVFRINPDSGALSPVGTLSFENIFTSGFAVHPTGKFAYASRSKWEFTGDDYVTAYTIDAGTGRLTPIGAPEAFPWGGGRIAVHPSGNFLYVGPDELRGPNNYFAYKFRRYAIDPITGILSFIGDSMLSPINSWTEGAILTFDPGGKFLYVTLGGIKPGTDQMQEYLTDSTTGELTPIAAPDLHSRGLTAPMTIHPNGQFAYVPSSIDEPFDLQITPDKQVIQAYNVDVAGALSEVDAPLTTEEPRSITVEPSGRFLYSVNWNSGISGYTINPVTGALTSMGAPLVAGESLYWALGIDPDGKFVYVVDGKISEIHAFAINQVNGALSPIGVPVPTTLNPSEFVPMFITTVRTTE